MNLDKIIPLLKTEQPSDILRKVVAWNETKSNHRNKASVRIGIGAGFQVEGVPLKIDKNGSAIFSTQDGSITYVSAFGISGIQILNPSMVMEILTDGSYFEIPESEVPTTLELKRNLKSFEHFLKDTYSIDIKGKVLDNEIETDAEKFQFQQFLNILQNTIQKLATDNLGKEALEGISTINISASEVFGVQQNSNGNLSIGIDFKNKFEANFKDKLQETLELNL